MNILLKSTKIRKEKRKGVTNFLQNLPILSRFLFYFSVEREGVGTLRYMIYQCHLPTCDAAYILDKVFIWASSLA